MVRSTTFISPRSFCSPQDAVDRQTLSQTQPINRQLFSDGASPRSSFPAHDEYESSDSEDFLEMDETEHPVATSNTNNCCNHCKDLKKACK